MGDTDFLQKFHNLEGSTIKDRKKNFYKLLKTPSLFQTEEQLSETLKNLNPKNYQESIFYIDTLLYFKKTDFLLELLKSGNELYTSKILKNLWFFGAAFNDIDPEKLVIEYLPCLSYSIRKKFLSRLLGSWTTEQIDLLFDALDKKFPQDPKKRKLWFSLVGILENQPLLKNPELCSEHFFPEDVLVRANGAKYIRKDANPRRCKGFLFLDDLSNSSDSTVFGTPPAAKQTLQYGLTVAIPVLHKCSQTKIKSVLDDNEIKLRPNQVLELININEECFKIYLDHINKITCNKYDETKVLCHLARKNPQLYLELEKDKKIISSRLGRKTTKKLIPLIKEDLLTNCEQYFRFLNQAAAIRKLGQRSHNFEIIYKNVFPNKFTGINAYSTCNRWLAYYPKGRRWNLFIKTCNEKFSDKNLNQILLLWSYQIKDLHPPKEVYLKWAEVHYQQQEGNFEEFLQYYEPSVAIPLIKEKINVTKDIYKRGNLIQLMIQSCSKHKDFNALEQVLQYICFRHRNEYPDFRNSLLREISNNFKLEELNENHWKYINEQIKILRIQKEFHFFVNAHFLQRYLEFLFKNKKDYKEALAEYINESVKERIVRMLDLNNKPIEKEIYIAIGKSFSDALNKESEQFVTYQTRMLTTILTFSILNPEYCINLAEIPDFVLLIEDTFRKQSNEFLANQKSIFSKLLAYNLTFPKYTVHFDDSKILNIISIITNHDKSFVCFSDVYKKYVLKKDRSKLENSMLLLYFNELFESYPDVNIVNWFIKNEPSTIVPHFDKIVKNTVNSYHALDVTTIRHCSYLKFDQKICKYYKNKLDDEGVQDKKKLVTALTVLLSTDDLKKLIEEKYLPQKDKLDLEDKVMVDMYHLQCKIIELSAQVVEPYKMLPTIMKFCRGDYLQSALRALYKTFYRSPEKILYSYVITLAKMAVSVRKHAIFLSCEVLDKEHTLNLLKNTTEGNVSSQKHLFSATLKYFLKNPSRDLLQKLIESMTSIDRNDLETLNNLANVTIPSRYRSQYLENCWNYFESLSSSGFKISNYLEQLLNKMRKDIAISLSAVFVTHIINKYCFKNSPDSLKGTNEFVIEILKTRVSERTQFFTLTFDLLSKSNIIQTSDFFDCFFRIIDKSSFDQSLVNEFFQYWTKYFTVVNFLNEHIELNLRIMQQSKSSIDNYGRDIINYLDKLISEFGFHVYNNFKDVFDKIVNLMNGLEYYSLLLALLKHKLDSTTCILVLEVLELRASNEAELKIYNDIRDIIKNVDIPIVCAYRNNFLRDRKF